MRLSFTRLPLTFSGQHLDIVRMEEPDFEWEEKQPINVLAGLDLTPPKNPKQN